MRDPRTLRALPSLPDRVDELAARVAAQDARIDELARRVEDVEAVLGAVRRDVRELTERLTEAVNALAAGPPPP